MKDKYQNFKCLLEYFVAHLEYMQNNTVDTNGCQKYIAPLVKKYRFTQSGQGYNGDNIQSQISDWEKYDCGTICIAVQIHSKTKDYIEKLELNKKDIW